MILNFSAFSAPLRLAFTFHVMRLLVTYWFAGLHHAHDALLRFWMVQ